MEIIEKPPHACLETQLGRLMAFVQVGKCICITPDEIPGNSLVNKTRNIGMRVARIERRALQERHFRVYRMDENFYVERTV